MKTETIRKHEQSKCHMACVLMATSKQTSTCHWQESKAIFRPRMDVQLPGSWPTPLVPTRIGGTRWVGHLDHFLRGYQGLFLYREQVVVLDCYAKKFSVLIDM
ncbi:hypothetical protein GOODEAATRI_030092 [Goodea atripinnis]|uniref:Uncharacterized protein n=1 Tax=Goodea atripinnis TaxID=208336 RepID=A0ABV0PSV2_9TELE